MVAEGPTIKAHIMSDKISDLRAGAAVRFNNSHGSDGLNTTVLVELPLDEVEISRDPKVVGKQLIKWFRPNKIS